MKKIKRPNVSGGFYPGNPSQLSNMIDDFLLQAKEVKSSPKALIAPHAGYIYSGAIAATAYKTLAALKDKIKTVVVLSPSHFWRFSGVAVTDADYFETPLGDIPVNKDLGKKLLTSLDFCQELPEAFEREHALEVHLPFLQKVLGEFDIVPLIVGPASSDEVAQIFSTLEGDGIFFVVSSDMSHFHNYDEACEIDGETIQMVENESYQNLSGEQMCGVYPVRGLLKWAKDKDMRVETLDARNSGDTAGDRDRVVGYASFSVS